MEKPLYAALDKAWKSTSRILFGQELGELSEYEDWLSEYLPKTARRKSHVSGKEVMLSKDAYPGSARFISEDELVMNRNYALDINRIKDIDSIIGALQENCEYTGNRFLGNSAFVESSDIVIDSQYVYNSTNIEQSSRVCSSFMLRRDSKHNFGSGWGGAGEFVVRVVGYLNLARCFESFLLGDCSDIYFSSNCVGCHDLMFSFGQRNKRHCIGNLQLPKGKYLQTKAKLLSEIASELREKKRFPSLFELFSGKPASPPSPKIERKNEDEDIAVLEKGFASTFNVLLKRKPSSMTDYEGWLSRNTGSLEEVTTPFGSKTHIPADFAFSSFIPRARVVSIDESLELGKLQVGEESLGSISSLIGALDGIAFFTPEMMEGETRNIIKSPLVYHSTNAYKIYDSTHSDNTGVSFLTLHSKYVYGCHRILESQFAMKCYNSLHLNRCLELDGCTKCADTYFSHNCEGMADSMFCFNYKGGRFVIGNTVLPKDKYLELKPVLLEQLASELERKKSLKWDIYNIGAKG